MAAETSAPITRSFAGSLDAAQVTSGVVRGPHGLFQRRVRVRVFGEPDERELVPASVDPARPHALAYAALLRLRAAAPELDPADLTIHSAFRSVALQAQVWAYRLDERRRLRADAGLPELSERDLERLQMKWTAKPGQSAHHTGLALDLGLYRLGKRGSKRSPTYTWLAQHARRFGFYPYLPEGWHWEYNPPGLVRQLLRVRAALARGAPIEHLLTPPQRIPIARAAT